MKNRVESEGVPSKRLGHGSSKATYSAPVLRVYGSVSSLTLGAMGSNTDMGTPATMSSDRSLKKNIVRVGDHPLGIGLYLFDYKDEHHSLWGCGPHLGVMADEVEGVLPQAVLLHPEGYKMVDYGMLDRAAAKVESGPSLVRV